MATPKPPTNNNQDFNLNNNRDQNYNHNRDFNLNHNRDTNNNQDFNLIHNRNQTTDFNYINDENYDLNVNDNSRTSSNDQSNMLEFGESILGNIVEDGFNTSNINPFLSTSNLSSSYGYSSDDLYLNLRPVDINPTVLSGSESVINCTTVSDKYGHISSTNLSLTLPLTGADSTVFNFWLFGFGHNNDADEIVAPQYMDAVMLACLGNQVINIAEEAGLSPEEVEEVGYQSIKHIMTLMGQISGYDQPNYAIPLGAFNRE